MANKLLINCSFSCLDVVDILFIVYVLEYLLFAIFPFSFFPMQRTVACSRRSDCRDSARRREQEKQRGGGGRK